MKRHSNNCFCVEKREGGKSRHLGSFTSAEEAALFYARHVTSLGAVAATAENAAAAAARVTGSDADELDGSQTQRERLRTAHRQLCTLQVRDIPPLRPLMSLLWSAWHAAEDCMLLCRRAQ